MQEHNPKKRQKQTQPPEYKNLTPFKQMQKHFKHYHNKETDYSIVYQPKQYQQIDGYSFAFLPYPKGVILVKNFNTKETVTNIAALSLNVFWRKPYRTNLSSKQDLYKKEEGEMNETLEQVQKTIKVSQANEEQTYQTPTPTKKGYYFNNKIRWANVGYQYDWTQRKYPNMKTQIPPSLNHLCTLANKLYNKIRSQQHKYVPQSAIINYYSQKDYMTGHLDDAEIDQNSPIYSFSFGLSCIFLIGGVTKDEKPIAVRLDSGDLLIMGQESRICYHGVPRIISNSYQGGGILLEKQQEWKNKTEEVERYLSGHRININVRQVYPNQ